MSATSKFQKKNTGTPSGGSERSGRSGPSRPISRKFVIDEIDEKAHIIYGRDVDRDNPDDPKGRKRFAISIDQGTLVEKRERAQKRNEEARKQGREIVPVKYVGYEIDGRMKNNFEPGSVVVVENTAPIFRDGNSKAIMTVTHGGEKYVRLSAQYVRGVSDAAPNKLLNVFISASSGYDRDSLKVWDIRAYGSHSIDVENPDDSFESLVGKIEDVREEWRDPSKYPPVIGVITRVLVPRSEGGYEEVESSAPLLMSNELDALPESERKLPDGGWRKPTRDEHYPMSGDDLREVAAEFVQEMQEKYPESEYRGRRFEIIPFRTFRPTRNGDASLSFTRYPLRALKGNVVATDASAQELVDDHNYVVQSIVSISGDKVSLPKDIRKGEAVVPIVKAMDFVNFISPFGFANPIGSRVFASDGGTVRVPENRLVEKHDPKKKIGQGGRRDQRIDENRNDAEHDVRSEEVAERSAPPATPNAPPADVVGSMWDGFDADEEFGELTPAPSQQAPASQPEPSASESLHSKDDFSFDDIEFDVAPTPAPADTHQKEATPPANTGTETAGNGRQTPGAKRGGSGLF